MAFNNVYRGKKVLITGNTRFQGELVVSMVTHAGSGGIRLFK